MVCFLDLWNKTVKRWVTTTHLGVLGNSQGVLWKHTVFKSAHACRVAGQFMMTDYPPFADRLACVTSRSFSEYTRSEKRNISDEFRCRFHWSLSLRCCCAVICDGALPRWHCWHCSEDCVHFLDFVALTQRHPTNLFLTLSVPQSNLAGWQKYRCSDELAGKFIIDRGFCLGITDFS